MFTARTQTHSRAQSFVDLFMSLRSVPDAAINTSSSEVVATQPHVEQFDHELATQILARIQSRLPDRIRDLTVLTTENAVILKGRCATFYTKQLAQHAAMGVLDYEQLINHIEVRMG